MKRLLLYTLVLSLTLLGSTSSFAAIHSNEGEMIKTDTFFSITPNSPYVQGIYSHQKIEKADIHSNEGVFEYYLNDQTFVSLDLVRISLGSIDGKGSGLKGSYLFNNGWFIGVNYDDFELSPLRDTTDTVVSPGYRFRFDESSYLAFSVDYAFSDVKDDIKGYDLDFRYYQDNYKLSGEIYHYKDSYTYGEIEGVYQLTDKLAAGLALTDYSDDDLYYTAGFTFKGDSYILDLVNGDGPSRNYYIMLNGMYRFSDHFASGVRLEKREHYDDLYYGALLKYTSKNINFSLLYFPEDFPRQEEISLSYFKTF